MFDESINRITLDRRIELLSLKNGPVIVMPFNGLAVNGNPTKDFSGFGRAPDGKKLEECAGKQFEKIRYLHSLVAGVEYQRLVDSYSLLAERIVLNQGFAEGLEALNARFNVVFVTSGLRDVCFARMGLDVKPDNIIGAEYEVDSDGLVAGSKLIITDELKGYVVDRLKESHFVVGIGESYGDRFLTGNAHLGIAVRPTCNLPAKYVVDSMKQAGLKVLELV